MPTQKYALPHVTQEYPSDLICASNLGVCLAVSGRNFKERMNPQIYIAIGTFCFSVLFFHCNNFSFLLGNKHAFQSMGLWKRI